MNHRASMQAQRATAASPHANDDKAAASVQTSAAGPGYIHNLHQTLGNQAVAQMVRAGAASYPMQTVQRKSNRTGLPDHLKEGVENLSGVSLDDVKVHYNSSKPAQLQALAYAEGTDIHVAPGQDKHLAHEAWHVVQQKQGRVNPTMQMDGVAINDDPSLEQEADMMGAQASQFGSAGGEPKQLQRSTSWSGAGVTQRMLISSVKKANGDEEERHVTAGDLGDSDAVFIEYAQLLENDSSAIVKGKLKEGITGLKKVLKDAPVDADDVKTDFVAGLIENNLWKEAGAENFDALRTEIARLNPEYPGVDEYTDQETIEYCESDTEPLEGWLNGLVTITGDKVSALVTAAASLPDAWTEYFAYVLYDKAKVNFYDMNDDFVPFVQPFISMISDINAGNITSLTYVRKYGNSPANYGAEFEVGGPADMATKYNGKAVVHTHYPGNTQPPNYGHTKPYDKRFNSGYGYTVVDLGTLLGMNDSQKAYNAL